MKLLTKWSIASILTMVMSFGMATSQLNPVVKAEMADSTYSVNNQETNKNPALFVQHRVHGNNLLVECILTGISFRESNKTNQNVGKLVVWVNGRIVQEVTAAAFIVKELPPGNHKVKLEVVSLTNSPYGVSKEFWVNIPK